MIILTKQEADQFLKEHRRITDVEIMIGNFDGPRAWFFTDDHCYNHPLKKDFSSWVPYTMYFRDSPVPHIKPRPGLEDGMITDIDRFMLVFKHERDGVHIQSEQELKDFLKLNQK